MVSNINTVARGFGRSRWKQGVAGEAKGQQSYWLQLFYFATADAGMRSSESAALLRVADLRLELKCSTAVWLVSVPWLMSCGTGWYLAICWHPQSDQSTVSKCFLTEIPPAPLSCCYKQLRSQHVDGSGLVCSFNVSCGRHQSPAFSHLTSDTGTLFTQWHGCFMFPRPFTR